MAFEFKPLRQKKYLDQISTNICLLRQDDGTYELIDEDTGRSNKGSRLSHWIDEARIDRNANLLIVCGWAAIADAELTEQKIDALLVSQKRQQPLEVVQQPRPDVEASNPNINSAFAGFYTLVDLTTLDEARYSLRLAIINSSKYSKVPYAGRVIVSDDELREKIDLMLDNCAGGETPEWYELAAGFYLHEELSELDQDPFSDTYRGQQLSLWRRLTKKDEYVSQQAEIIGHDVPQYLDPRPFPCCTGHLDHIGNHLLQVGNILKCLELREGDAVLENGAGCGFLTMFMASSGLDVSAVDINPDCINIIDQIAKGRGLEVSTLAGEFGEVPEGKGPFDAVVFYESFHHCLDFENVLDRMHTCLKDDGKMVFACEPIYEGFSKPWGLRLDGQSLFEIMNKSWMELGFREDFFHEVLVKHGFTAEKHLFPDIQPIYTAYKTR